MIKVTLNFKSTRAPGVLFMPAALFSIEVQPGYDLVNPITHVDFILF